MPPFLSVIIPTYNMAATLPGCLTALKTQEGLRYGRDYEIIVVDDGSTDHSAEIAAQAGVLLSQQANQGAAAARNAGVRAAKGAVVAFTDADCQPEPDWLHTIRSAFAQADLVGLKGAYLTRQKNWVARFVQLEYESKYARMLGFERIDFIDTYSAAYRKDIFTQNNGFNPIFPGSSIEDQEFSFRLAAKGYRLAFVPQARVVHIHDTSLSQYVRRKYKIGFWKSVLLHWLPEKTFSDSHTAPSQRWEIVLLGLVILTSAAALVYPLFWMAALCFLVILAASGLPLTGFILQRDPPIALITPLMLVLRAAALGCGLICGLAFPPRRKNEQAHGLILRDRLIKRIIDIVVSLVGLLVCLPILLIAGILIKLEDGGRLFFTQIRAGENGKPFRIIKLRTMCADSEAKLKELVDMDTLAAPSFKLTNDPRVTRTGRFLRRWSIDEVPQFINVLKGEMSLVGPRPEEVCMVERYTDHQRQRLVVKPGMSGPMQINGRGILDFHQRLALELEYIQNYSLIWDIEIMLKTFPAILNGRGAY
jgi:lipopolysaccharide/colanic/teichoic acid biosynthesis glycosyltransferase/glycosyltransferase involved in cell wall biosynthesis